MKMIRFIFISTDGVYPSIEGNYAEADPVVPYNKYGWTKLAAESCVQTLANFCIIRTRFFDPDHLKFDSYAIDAYSSAMPIEETAKAIKLILQSDYRGVINVGAERLSDYDRYKHYKRELKACYFKDILANKNYRIACDASLDTTIWKQLQKKFAL